MGGVYDEQAASRYMTMGAQFILTGSDHGFILAGGSVRTAFLRRQAGTLPAAIKT